MNIIANLTLSIFLHTPFTPPFTPLSCCHRAIIHTVNAQQQTETLIHPTNLLTPHYYYAYYPQKRGLLRLLRVGIRCRPPVFSSPIVDMNKRVPDRLLPFAEAATICCPYSCVLSGPSLLSPWLLRKGTMRNEERGVIGERERIGRRWVRYYFFAS